MNKTELVARRWLEEQGHKGIVFFPKTTPDFHTNRGYFEVKRLYGNAIVLSGGQKAKIGKSRAKVLVFKDGQTSPSAILNSRSIQGASSQGFRIVVVNTLPRHNLDFSGDLEKKIEDWRARQRPIPTLKEAVQHLLKKALGEKSK